MKELFKLTLLLGTTFLVVNQACWFLSPVDFIERAVSLVLVSFLGCFTFSNVYAGIEVCTKEKE